MSYFKAAPSIEKMNSDWNNEPHLDIMNEKFGVGVTEEHRQGQSLLDVFYCRRAGLILGITEWGVFTLGIWTQIILHFWSCLKLDTWSHFWSKAACCCCFGLQEERDSVLHGALCMAVLAWHSWQFSAISRKCYLILHGRESSEGSWWPCLELSVPLATQQPGVVSSNKSWNAWASCNWTDNSGASFILSLPVSALIILLLAHRHQTSVLDLCIWRQTSAKPKLLAHHCASACTLHSACVSSACFLGAWDYRQLVQLSKALASSPAGILVKVLCFQGGWPVIICNAGCS